MLGESPAKERARFAHWLKSMPWCGSETRAHEGFERDAFRALLDAPAPVAGARRSPERIAWRELVWNFWRAFNLLQAQRQLDAAATL